MPLVDAVTGDSQRRCWRRASCRHSRRNLSWPPERKVQQRRRLAFATGILGDPADHRRAIRARAAGVVRVRRRREGVSGFHPEPAAAGFGTGAFTPEYTSVEIRRALWARPFEGWWISEKPSAQIELDSDGWWLSKDDQSPDRAIIIVLRPNAANTVDRSWSSSLAIDVPQHRYRAGVRKP